MTKHKHKVGILTFHEVFNPGAFLQAYATQGLVESIGCTAELINYNPEAHRYSAFKHMAKLGWRFPFRIRGWTDNLRRDLAFQKSRNANFKLSQRFNSREELNKFHYDSILVGADIVWNYEMENLGRDPVYFGDKLNTDNLIAFSPSAGSCNAENQLPQYVELGLKKFSKIAVRDDNTAKIVHLVLGVKPEVLCDPTFQLKESILKRRFKEKEQILVYLLPQLVSRKLVDQIKNLGRKLGLPIVSVLYRNSWADKNMVSLNPFDWLDEICSSKYVITNTFHGSIFCSLAEKNFALELNNAIKNKTERMIIEMGLGSRFFTRSTSLGDILSTVPNYEHANQYISNEARRQKEFLTNCLKLN